MAEILDSPWVVAGIAFALGLLVGWMTWGGPWRANIARVLNANAGDAAAEKAGRDMFNEDAGLDGNLKTVIAEINAASARLEVCEDGEAALNEEIEQLDQAVKRANGRLKLILKSADRPIDEA